MKALKISGAYIRLCDALKLAGAAETGGMAKMRIINGEVLVNGSICSVKGKKLYPGDRFSLQEEEFVIEP
ncbi:MAG: hypothetical protein DBX52_03940 [Clostridiales bacterium]|nr:MAG: hypothetical protein DBX52_03940 [Clostridiales bacterium]